MKRLLFVLLLLVPILTFAMRKEKKLVGVVTGALCSHPRGEKYELLGINVPQDIIQKFFGKVHRERATIIANRILKGDNVV